MSEWKETTLGDVINLKRGYDLPESQRLEGSIPIYSSSGISGFHNSCKSLSPGVITGRYGTIGKVFISNTPFWPLNTTLYVQDFKGNDEVFIYYFLNKIDWTKFNDKSAVPGVNRNDLHQEDVLLPPLAEQKKIANILSCLDAKIDNLRRQNETLEEIARSIFKHWFIDFEFPNADGKPYKSSGGAMVRSDLGDIPEGWQVGNIKNIMTLNYGKSLIAETRIKGKYPVIGSNGIVDTHNDFFVTAPGIVIGRKGTIGKVIWVEKDFYPIDTTFYIQDILGCNGLYFHYFVLKNQNFSRLTSDSAVPGLNRDMAYSVELVIPIIEQINEYNLIAKTVFDKVSNNSNQIQVLTKTRDALLPKLMSGQLRVKE